ncbi:vascular endothelial growth factor receptor 1-like isoform X1 [Diorhabda sublineata]|uniref:vascular endothelial growth factor receptor 1-like isoform X1 n=1 Tax=Diorhabda sublineata TaxID=1163346 RepID=UPI0024E0CF81|nr:vascular endothelial growth factor receptor 1-like isoform X1 [Diorhabda sublineata]
MALKNKVIFSVILISEFMINFSIAIKQRPNILKNGGEHTIDLNSNYTLVCEGNKKLKWTIPKVQKENMNRWTRFETEEVQYRTQYRLSLHIYNMSYPFVGFYNCSFDNSEDNNSNQNDGIYLFVNDENNLAVFDRSLNIFVRKGDIAEMPCRPTSPAVNVSLKMMDRCSGEVPLNVLTKNHNMYKYNHYKGISTNDTRELQETLYMCIFQRDKKKMTIKTFLTVEDSVSSLSPPVIMDQNKGHTVVGGNIHLNCNLRYPEVNKEFLWIPPKGQINTKRMVIKFDDTRSSLLIANATLDDRGTYVCNVSDHQGHFNVSNITVNVFDKTEQFISMYDVDNSSYRETKDGDEYVELKAEVWGHPQPNFTWYNNTGNEIASENDKYEVTYSQELNITSLKIKNINIDDYGNYTLIGNNGIKKYLPFFVNVSAKPSVSLKTAHFHLLREEGTVQCVTKGNPTPKITWEDDSYLKLRYGNSHVSISEGKIIKNNPPILVSELKINATQSVAVKCIATNVIDSVYGIIRYNVTDVLEGFDISGFADTAIVNLVSKTAVYAIGENVSLKCSVDASYYSDVAWLLDGNFIQETKRMKFKNSSTNYSSSITLNIDNSNRDDSGIYICQALIRNGGTETKYINLTITDPIKTEIISTNMEKEMVENFPKSITMRCMVKGLPKPKIFWYKDGIDFEVNGSRIQFEEEKQILIFNETVAADAGNYKCVAVYKNNRDFREVTLRFKNAPQPVQDWLIVIIVLLLFVLVVVVAYLTLRVKKERKLKRELEILGLANFEKGAVENINPELGIDDQAELLPYDKKWEFPIEQLKLGKQLGSGAFGVVLKGEAKYIIEGEPITTVAVKMTKKNADNTYLKALASELKIMVHLGKHLNVVNLLGACTKNVAKRELLVIVEYCQFGNLQNYLLKHRDHFVNQIDSQTGKINYLIGQELLDRTYSLSSNRSNVNSPLMKYAALGFSDSRSAMGDYRVHQNSFSTEITTSNPGDDGVLLSNNSTQPEWRSNYKGDYKGTVKPISTKDLIIYSFQVARGMEYLASRKVLHGDLAARNILLSEDNIVKICDFGLAKSMYKNDNYRKKGDCPLPVKWMAIESIRDRVFSTQSDCWSFGIVLWEFFSLGRSPYPGIPADERLYQKLVDGYRLESPDYCPKEIYQIMTECWSVKPALRPSFTKLTERIGTLLEDTLRKHYVDLNDPYLAINTKMMQSYSDYLSMLSPPNFDVIVSPNYVNDIMTNSSPSEDGYMSMKPNTIFSPRITDDGEVFNFDLKHRRNRSSNETNGHELMPMLQSDVHDNNDKILPASPAGVSNPSYHLPPKIMENDIKDKTMILKSVDNYVNMPENKCLVKENTVDDSGNIMNLNEKRGKYGCAN